MLPLGSEAPDFELQDVVSDRTLSRDDLKGEKGTLVMFICNHCPYVIHVHEQLVKLPEEYRNNGISTVAISSNDISNYPQDSPEKMKELAKEKNFSFPYLYDESQEIAKAYEAACTPDFYLFDEDLKLVYRGQLDGSRPGNNEPVTGKDLRDAIDNLLSGNSISEDQRPSMGCSIKWKAN